MPTGEAVGMAPEKVGQVVLWHDSFGYTLFEKVRVFRVS